MKFIAITSRTRKEEFQNIDFISQDYLDYFKQFNINLIILPTGIDDYNPYFENNLIEGLILSGGNDISPELYNYPNINSKDCCLRRDKTEQKLLEIAIKKNIPVLGICRGMQFINIYFGGKLIQDLKQEHVKKEHEIEIKNQELKEKINPDMIIVNSYHNQGLTSKEISNELEIIATTKEGMIEALNHKTYPIAGIQWHPERNKPQDINKILIKSFLNEELFWKRKTKAIILAAGMGTRLNKYTQNLPKCMLNFDGKPLIQRQVDTLQSCGINDITIVKGYMADKIQIPGVKYYTNEEFNSTNMVETLFKAENEMNSDILICYADILYEKRIINQILESDCEIGVTVDTNYWDYWKARLDNPEIDIESLVIDNTGKIIDIGDTNCSLDKAQVRYVGLIKISKNKIPIFKQIYHHNKILYYDKNEPWLRSKSFKKAYMTCLLQALINADHEVKPIKISKGWLEFDTNEDYEKAIEWIKQNKLNQFYNIDK